MICPRLKLAEATTTKMRVTAKDRLKTQAPGLGSAAKALQQSDYIQMAPCIFEGKSVVEHNMISHYSQNQIGQRKVTVRLPSKSFACLTPFLKSL